MYVGHTLCLLPRAVTVNQHLIYISLPDHIWVIIVYMGPNRDQLTCSIHGKCLLVGKKERQDDEEHGGGKHPKKNSGSDVSLWACICN